jgi:hypothetical protein
MECRFIGYVESDSGYIFYHPDKGLIESQDVAFIKNTNQITPINEIRVLQVEDAECQTPQDILAEKKEHNIDLQNSRSKRKYNDPPNLDIDNKNSENKKQRQMTMEPRVARATLGSMVHPQFFFLNKLHDTWRYLIGLSVISVKSTNSQRME